MSQDDFLDFFAAECDFHVCFRKVIGLQCLSVSDFSPPSRLEPPSASWLVSYRIAVAGSFVSGMDYSTELEMVKEFFTSFYKQINERFVT